MKKKILCSIDYYPHFRGKNKTDQGTPAPPSPNLCISNSHVAHSSSDFSRYQVSLSNIKKNDQRVWNLDFSRFISRCYSYICAQRAHTCSCLTIPSSQLMSWLRVTMWGKGGQLWLYFWWNVILCIILDCYTRSPSPGHVLCCIASLLVWCLNAYVYIDFFFPIWSIESWFKFLS